MRVVGGIWKGRVIDAPPGRETRPTTDRTRESIASSVLSFFDLSLEGVRMLDAFAGSGAFGIEMLSRGAAYCTFIDADRRSIQVVKKNLAGLKVPPTQYRIVCADTYKSADTLAVQGTFFDLVFLDPPYATSAEKVGRLVTSLHDAECARMGTIVVYERSASAPQLDLPFLELVRTKKLGETSIDYYRIGDDGEH